MKLKVELYRPNEEKPMATAFFANAPILAVALMKEAPFEKGFDMRVSINLKGKEYGEEFRFPSTEDRVLPAGWSKSEECVVIATEVFNKIKETIKEQRAA